VKKIFLALLVALLGLAGAGCGATDPAAVTINGHEISVRELDNELEEIRDNVEYRRLIEAGNTPVLGTAKGALDAAFASEVATFATYYELIHQEVARRKLDVTDEALAAAREQLHGRLGINTETGQPDPEMGQKVLANFSKDYQTILVRREAEIVALQDDLADVDISDAAIERYYRDNEERFLEACAHHILVDTEPAAQAVKARLEGGADFATVAREASTDPSAAENGGDLGCASPASYVPEFADAITTQPVGVVGSPVQTQFGFHIIRVDRRDLSRLEDVRAQIESELQQQGSGALNDWLAEALTKAKVKVNPRFGSWDANALPIPKVVPPQAPTTLAPEGGSTTIDPLLEPPVDQPVDEPVETVPESTEPATTTTP
jgi:foldase protein PrsA